MERTQHRHAAWFALVAMTMFFRYREHASLVRLQSAERAGTRLASQLAAKQRELDAATKEKKKIAKARRAAEEKWGERLKQAVSMSAELAQTEDELTKLETKGDRGPRAGRDAGPESPPAAARRHGHVVNFGAQPDRFADTLAACVTDKRCHVHFLHIPKTGGRTVEAKFRLLHPSNAIDTCCLERVTRRFEAHTAVECYKPFNSYEIHSDYFRRSLLPSCAQWFRATGDRLVAMTAYRLPVQRAISSIHQVCNKESSNRTREVQEQCERCDYAADRAAWAKFARQTNVRYADLHRDLVVGLAGAGVPVLTLDTEDISPAFARLAGRLPAKYARRLTEGATDDHNPERTGLCNFGVHSDFLRELAPANAVYRNLTMGR